VHGASGETAAGNIGADVAEGLTEEESIAAIGAADGIESTSIVECCCVNVSAPDAVPGVLGCTKLEGESWDLAKKGKTTGCIIWV